MNNSALLVVAFWGIEDKVPYSTSNTEERPKESVGGGAHPYLIPALGRQRRVDLHEFKVSQVYRSSSRTEKSCLEKQTKLTKPKRIDKIKGEGAGVRRKGMKKRKGAQRRE